MNEFESVYFADWTEKAVKVLDSVLLYGDDFIGSNLSMANVELIFPKMRRQGIKVVLGLIRAEHWTATSRQPALQFADHRVGHLLISSPPPVERAPTGIVNVKEINIF